MASGRRFFGNFALTPLLEPALFFCFLSTKTLAFPQVDSPGVLASTWLVQIVGNVAFLVFVSDFWIFKVRRQSSFWSAQSLQVSNSDTFVS